MPMVLALACTLLLSLVEIAHATVTACGSALLERGHVSQVMDARTLRLTDGREIRLAGIVPPADASAAKIALAALVAERDVELRGDSDMPDRYGRQHAFVVPIGNDTPVQIALLRAGEALVTGTVADRACATELAAAEAIARQARQGIWAKPGVIKSARKPAEVLARLGHFAVVEGKIVSARKSGATFYLNFGRHWVRDFAVIIPRQMIGLLPRDGIDIRALAGRQVRVRGWIEQRRGPRIQLRGTGQIEVLDPR